MSFGIDSSAPSTAPEPVPRHGRVLLLSEWSAAGFPLLRSPRETVTGLCERHLPVPATTVVAVLAPDERLAASASFSHECTRPDGWECRNLLLGQLRQVVPHELRRRIPVHTAVVLHCRTGGQGWTPADGAWMWGIRDACTLHGLRCGAFITLTPAGWQVLGEERGGRHPTAGRAQGKARGVRDLEEGEESRALPGPWAARSAGADTPRPAAVLAARTPRRAPSRLNGSGVPVSGRCTAVPGEGPSAVAG
ncbi:hypothetical protein [Streptomyces sp. NRRL F-5053]|uniref:hypothetical protein n=1 Tax=Streptomyces sp. NRRL F-5053 TaxID=1463854 RepID=UPI0007C578F3